jgi:hypothetical protein
MWLIGVEQSCIEGNRYPVLANTDTGALHLDVVCAGRIEGSTRYRYAFSNFDEVDGIIRKAARVGFALPLEGDAFVVVRFTLNGAVRAITVMREAATARANPNAPATGGTRDQRL